MCVCTKTLHLRKNANSKHLINRELNDSLCWIAGMQVVFKIVMNTEALNFDLYKLKKTKFIAFKA